MMSTFDPFITSEYQYEFLVDPPLESEPNFTKKTDSEILSEILSSSIAGIHKDFRDTEYYTIAER